MSRDKRLQSTLPSTKAKEHKLAQPSTSIWDQDLDYHSDEDSGADLLIDYVVALVLLILFIGLYVSFVLREDIIIAMGSLILVQHNYNSNYHHQ